MREMKVIELINLFQRNMSVNEYDSQYTKFSSTMVPEFAKG